MSVNRSERPDVPCVCVPVCPCLCVAVRFCVFLFVAVCFCVSLIEPPGAECYDNLCKFDPPGAEC